jgi:tetratricopeptide (TPR) repeat protein
MNIDSLKKILPSLSDSMHIDCMNNIVHYYYHIHNQDSIKHYLALAYDEAKKLNYIHGIAVSLTQQAAQNSNDFLKWAKMDSEALKWYDRTNNKKGIDLLYIGLGNALFAESIYDQAMNSLQHCIEWSRKAGNYKRMQYAYSLIGQIYRESGKYDSAFEVFKQAIQIAKKLNDSSWIAVGFINMGDLYKAIEDYPTGLEYYSKAFRIMGNKKDIDVWDYTIFAELFTLNRQYDSALYYYNYFDSTKSKTDEARVFLISKGEYYLFREQHAKALANFIKGLSYHKQFKDVNQIKRTLLDIAKTYAALRDQALALKYAKEGLELAQQTNSLQYIRDAYEIISSVYDQLHRTDSAYFYYKKYIAIRDIVSNAQTKVKFDAFNYEQKIDILNKEKELQQQQIIQSSQQKIFLIAGISGLLLLGFIIIRNALLKRKNEKNLREIAENELQLQKLESQKQLSELEMQALRAQMNPHFIFNSLNSINRFILQNNRQLASEYLTKFSRLVRMILQNSQASLITLDSELEALNLYLEMEALRFNYHFIYKVSVAADVDLSILKVPPLIIQPYAENAIWHGLMHKEEKGHLDIELWQEDNDLFFKITDDGIGRKQSSALSSKSATKYKSMGLEITASRIAMLEHANKTESPVKINDLIHADGSSAGTEVIIKMPIIYD